MSDFRGLVVPGDNEIKYVRHMNDVFPVVATAQWVEVPPDCEEMNGWIWDGTNVISPSDAKTLDDVKNDKYEELDGEFRNRLYAKVTYNGNDYDMDQKSVININAVLTTMSVAKNANAPFVNTVNWRDANNNVVALTQDDLMNLSMTAMSQKQALYEQYWTLKDSVKNATTKTQVNNISWV